MNVLKKFWNDETGLELSEYAVGAAMLATGVALVAFNTLGDRIAFRILALILRLFIGNNSTRSDQF